MLGAASFFTGMMLSGAETSWSDRLGGPDAFYEYGQLITIPLGFLLLAISVFGITVIRSRPLP